MIEYETNTFVGQVVPLEDPVQLAERHHPLGLLGLGLRQHQRVRPLPAFDLGRRYL